MESDVGHRLSASRLRARSLPSTETFLANYEEKGIRVGDIVVVLKLHKKGLVTGFLPFLIGWVDFRFASPISFIS